MFKHIRANLIVTILTLVICSVLYPLTLLAIGQGVVPKKASGGILEDSTGKPFGSRLIAQEFKGDQWFQARPSAAGYNGAASSGSNLGANNPKLRERVEETLKARSEKETVPLDAVTASGSGLDPHITLRNAKQQQARVAKAWIEKTGRDSGAVNNIIINVLNDAAFSPMFGLVGGEDIINVLEVNSELSRRLSK